MVKVPRLLALDFDGVICDGMQEYFQTSVGCYGQIWQDKSPCDLQVLAPEFYRLRPLIESGWEMPLLLRARVLGILEADIQAHWPTVCLDLLRRENLERSHLSQTLDRVRDGWIEKDLEGWLGLHRFYPGISQRLREWVADNLLFYIITTKEGRFVQQLLSGQGIAIAPSQIVGKEVQRPKAETLRLLLESEKIEARDLWFVEDLLKTLYKVQLQPDLQHSSLFLADWGYNTPECRQSVVGTDIHLLSLAQFAQPFSQWR